MGKLIAASILLVLVAVYLTFFSGSDFELKCIRDQRVLITGASSGIGEQLAYQYAKLGARLIVTARRADLLSNVSRTCRELGAQEAHYVAADMANPEDRRKVVAQVKKRLGGLDQLVLNHAILTEGWWLGTAENLTYLELVHRVNFHSYVDLASQALPMLTASRGRIGVVSSGFGEVGAVMVSVYSSVKFALHGFFSSLRQELHHKNTGVSVTLLVLGPVASDTMVSLSGRAIAHIPISGMIAPPAAARAILESVAQRHYKAYIDWKAQLLFTLNGLLPQTIEDSLSSVMMNDDGVWTSRLLFFIWRTF